MTIAWRMSSGSKPAVTSGLPYCAGTNRYGRFPTTVDTCPGPRNPSSRRSGDSRIALIGGTIVTWLQNTEKFVTPSSRALKQRDGRRRRRRLEPDGEEHHLAVRVVGRELQRVERRVDEAHVGTPRLGLEEVSVAAGHAHHVAERREDDAGRLRDRDGVVDATHRDHADGAARPVHELDVRREHVLDAVSVDGVRVPAAHLHELEVVGAGERR